MIKNLFVFVIGIVLWGCATVPVPGKLEVIKGNIHAQGRVATAEKGGALIRAIQIDLSTAPSEFLEDIWVVVRIVGKTTLAKVTPQLLKENGYTIMEVKPPREGLTDRYCDSGFSFDFNRDGKLIRLEANTGSNDDTSTENPRIGSFSSTLSLALPCTLPQFNSVFGKSDKVRFIRVN